MTESTLSVPYEDWLNTLQTLPVGARMVSAVIEFMSTSMSAVDGIVRAVWSENITFTTRF